MYSPIALIFKYLKYLVSASNGKGHGVHSPFVYNFIREVLNDQRKVGVFDLIEQRRKALLCDQTILTIEDFGAGSRIKKTNQRAVKEIAASSLKPKKFSQLLFRMVQYYSPQMVLELGTSLGITSAYLASANASAQLVTMEGSVAIASLAKESFAQLHLKNIAVVPGNFDTTLGPFLNTVNQLDFVFIDGNHRQEPTVRYFKQLLPLLHENSILVFDDIHWSKEMEAAWAEIQQEPSVTVTIDLFFVGLVFFRKENKVKQDFVIRF